MASSRWKIRTGLSFFCSLLTCKTNAAKIVLYRAFLGQILKLHAFGQMNRDLIRTVIGIWKTHEISTAAVHKCICLI